MIDIQGFENRVGVYFEDKSLLVQALAHSTFLNENPSFKIKYNLKENNNERLEFLGDSVLEIVTAHYIYSHHPGREGTLTKIRETLVNNENLLEISKRVSIEDYLLIGKGVNDKHSILEDSLEALIAAIFLDQGYDAAENFIKKYVLCDMERLIENLDIFNPKGKLQEEAVKRGYDNPKYQEIGESGPDDNKMFDYAVYLGDIKIAEGRGKSKKEAEKNAAQKALEIKGW